MNWENITDNQEVIELLKQREEIEKLINELDLGALVKYEIEALNS